MAITFIRYCSAIVSVITFSLLLPALCIAQDPTVPRFELGGSFTGIRQASVDGSIGPGVEGAVNFGRHIALDGTLNWLPSTFSQTVNGFFGAKVGARSGRFGYFAKVRPGFFTTAEVFRESTFNLPTGQQSARFARLTESALDLGGVIEFYPTRRCLMRWDMGDTLMFEPTIRFNVIGVNAPPSLAVSRGATNHLQFSTAVHYRF